MTNNTKEIINIMKKLKNDTSNKTYYVVEDLSIFKLTKDFKLFCDTFFYCDELIYSDEAKEIVGYYKINSRICNKINKKSYNNLVSKDNAQGLIGTFKYLKKEIGDFKNAKFVVVLDGLETPGNVGSIMRTCDACGVDLILVINTRARIFNPKVMQASRGMQFFNNIIETDFKSANDFLTSNGFDIFLAEPIDGKNYKYYKYDGKIAIVVGSERYGIDKSWYDYKHNRVFIPMIGKMTSLNVSIAASIVIYEAFMKRV
ncbi:MAG: TrmH family RNA methyltransferase [Bacilli bacterium]|nr:TrmH family RNA methyltransferase [Bacilli bacterium]